MINRNLEAGKPRPFQEVVPEYLSLKAKRFWLQEDIEALVPDEQERNARMKLTEAPDRTHQEIADTAKERDAVARELRQLRVPGPGEGLVSGLRKIAGLPMSSAQLAKWSGRARQRQERVEKLRQLQAEIEETQALRDQAVQDRLSSAETVRVRGGSPQDRVQRQVASLTGDLKALDVAVLSVKREASMALEAGSEVPPAVRTVIGEPVRDGRGRVASVYADAALKLAAFHLKAGPIEVGQPASHEDSLTAELAADAAEGINRLSRSPSIKVQPHAGLKGPSGGFSF